MSAYISDSTLCCHWCKIPLGNASQVTYLNGNLPICDLCLGKDKRIAELEATVERMKCCGNCNWYKKGYSDRCYDLITHKKCDNWEVR